MTVATQAPSDPKLRPYCDAIYRLYDQRNELHGFLRVQVKRWTASDAGGIQIVDSARHDFVYWQTNSLRRTRRVPPDGVEPYYVEFIEDLERGFFRPGKHAFAVQPVDGDEHANIKLRYFPLDEY